MSNEALEIDAAELSVEAKIALRKVTKILGELIEDKDSVEYTHALQAAVSVGAGEATIDSYLTILRNIPNANEDVKSAVAGAFLMTSRMGYPSLYALAVDREMLKFLGRETFLEKLPFWGF